MPRWFQIVLSLVLFAAVVAPTPTYAGGRGRFVTGNDLHRKCQDRSAQMYVLGVYDALSITEGTVSDTVRCVPDGVVSSQLTDIACKFVDENPAARHLNAALLVTRSFYVAFDCKLQ